LKRPGRRNIKNYVEELELNDLAERLENLKGRVGCKVDPALIAKLVRQDRDR